MVQPVANNSDGKARHMIPTNARVLTPLAQYCDYELAVTENGMATLVFTKDLPDGIEWVEYDVDLAVLNFVTWGGDVMGLGVKIHEPFRKPLMNAREITMMQITADSREVLGVYPAELVIRHIGV
jgi:hypothetical protein